MALFRTNHVQISGISCCVPSSTINNQYDNLGLFEPEALDKAIKAVGVINRHVVDQNTCTSDLCFAAAKELLLNMNLSKSDIDGVIFVSQTPDYKLPATSCSIQNRLGLSKDTIALDINLGCSGYVYGLMVGSSILLNQSLNKVLLLTGDTITKIVSPKDKTTNLLFGDAGSATIIEKNFNSKPLYFSLNSDGSGRQTIIQEGGGCRKPSSIDTIEQKPTGDGNYRSLENLSMDGAEVFNFTIREIPSDINRLVAFSGYSFQDISFFVMHQANKFMLDFLLKKLKIPAHKAPISLHKYGNTSSASIPLTIVSEVAMHDCDLSKVLMSGFGVGLSWGSVIADLNKCYINPLIEV